MIEKIFASPEKILFTGCEAYIYCEPKTSASNEFKESSNSDFIDYQDWEAWGTGKCYRSTILECQEIFNKLKGIYESNYFWNLQFGICDFTQSLEWKDVCPQINIMQDLQIQIKIETSHRMNLIWVRDEHKTSTKLPVEKFICRYLEQKYKHYGYSFGLTDCGILGHTYGEGVWFGRQFFVYEIPNAFNIAHFTARKCGLELINP